MSKSWEELEEAASLAQVSGSERPCQERNDHKPDVKWAKTGVEVGEQITSLPMASH